MRLLRLLVLVVVAVAGSSLPPSTAAAVERIVDGRAAAIGDADVSAPTTAHWNKQLDHNAHTFGASPARSADEVRLRPCDELFAPSELRARAAELLGPSDNVVVLGRQPDTAVANGWPGHTVLDADDWSPDLYDAFIEELITQRRTVYLASPLEGNLIQTTGQYAGQPTIFASELAMLDKAGYVPVGEYLVPPG